eukprot:11185588-Lingulodinium_polyedra.AAC.1
MGRAHLSSKFQERVLSTPTTRARALRRLVWVEVRFLPASGPPASRSLNPFFNRVQACAILC